MHGAPVGSPVITQLTPLSFGFTLEISLATRAASQAVALFEQQFSTHVNGARLCGAPGPALFEQCQ